MGRLIIILELAILFGLLKTGFSKESETRKEISHEGFSERNLHPPSAEAPQDPLESHKTIPSGLPRASKNRRMTPSQPEARFRRNHEISDDEEVFVSPNRLRPAKLSGKEVAAIDFFLFTISQLAQLAMMVGLMIPMINLHHLPQFLLSILTSYLAIDYLTGRSSQELLL